MNFYITLLVIVMVNWGEFLQHTLNSCDSELSEFLKHTLSNWDVVNCGEFLQHTLSNWDCELQLISTTLSYQL